MRLLVTGVAGYIGSSFAYKCLSEGHEVLGVDNFLNSTKRNIEILSNKSTNFSFIKHDLSSNSLTEISKFISNSDIDYLVHFAALKSVSDSEKNPVEYWENNLRATINCVKIMKANNIKKIIFSSSATVYGNSKVQPVNEEADMSSLSAYGSTKIASENFLSDCAKAKLIDLVMLRYFNPVGSHRDHKIFEDPSNEPNNLMPRIVRTALGIDKSLNIFGGDYDTKDGTAERDFIHIDDLIDGHIAAMNYLRKKGGLNIFNLGTGNSVSVKELITKFEKVNNIKIVSKIVERRDGDIEVCYADPAKAKNDLNWEAKKGIDQMCIDSWAPFKKK